MSQGAGLRRPIRIKSVPRPPPGLSRRPDCRELPVRKTRHCRIAGRKVRGLQHRCRPRKRPLAAGPVAQWLEPAAHNGLVAGSSPAGPTSLRSLRELRLGKPVPQRAAKRAKAAAPEPNGRRRAATAGFGSASPCHKRAAKRAKAAAPKPDGRRRAAAAGCGPASPCPNENIENNPMQSSRRPPRGNAPPSK
jgi:hypothetical protein